MDEPTRTARPAEPWRDRARWERAGGLGTTIWGAILLAVGLWLFVEITLGYDLPAIPWADLWPVVLIVIGAWIVLRAARRPA